ncbi:helix-turn-helix domain-containing protein [Amycolatopsis roodepoortensis]|uniref:helix-turn-helix domain-containing protein n=1 Tax=Amycolatopsis roodepoortensis TaxID=700274 RepID=UPI00214B8D81|nr:helix-turn-helix domain-containing protein [Amycolatopsis roodepoortensis]UUV36486.1 helix-turn-helix domain-containing protein [Amycolatopsis roodepoortensis]
MEPLWTTEELASFLRVPVKTLADWRLLGKGPPFTRVGKYVRYYPDGIREWLSQSEP